MGTPSKTKRCVYYPTRMLSEGAGTQQGSRAGVWPKGITKSHTAGLGGDARSSGVLCGTRAIHRDRAKEKMAGDTTEIAGFLCL